MGLGKTKGSTRINRYEQQASATSFDSLGELAQALNVPPAYLLADNAAMADAILALGQAGEAQQSQLVRVLQGLSADPAFAKTLLKALALPKSERDKVRKALAAALRDADG